VFISCNILKIGLCVSVFVSFICKLFLLILYVWYFSDVFVFLCFCVLVMSIVSVYGPVGMSRVLYMA
jgi:hypothetical protein